MVKKLFKHEFLAYTRAMSIVYIILLIAALATRIIFCFESDTMAYDIISTFSLLGYGVSVVAALLFSTAMGVIRFYKNLFSAEGYLTLTLPVTVCQHITVKAVTAVTVQIVTMILVLLSACLVCAGEVFSIIMEELFRLLNGRTVLIGCEAFILLVMTCFCNMMLYYTCIALGQFSKKNRILAAVGVYFIYYIISQIVSAVFTVLVSTISILTALGDVITWMVYNPFASANIIMWSLIFLTAAFVAVEFLVIRWVITKKLNLE